jgi:hypothetical protein
VNRYQSIYDSIQRDPRYMQNLDWGTPRSGHPEGTVRAHIAELERNLKRLRDRLSEDDYWKLKVLIHVHDSFKAEAKSGTAITDPRSHASLARAFLAEFCDDADLLAMVQYHDEPYALWRKASHGDFNTSRFAALLKNITDWNLFTAFLIIDGCTAGKDRAPLQWLFENIAGNVTTSFSAADLL